MPDTNPYDSDPMDPDARRRKAILDSLGGGDQRSSSNMVSGDPVEGPGFDMTPPPAAPAPADPYDPGTRQPTADQNPNPQNRGTEPWWWDYNGGSPPAVPLGGGMQGWAWDGSRWNQTPTPGITGGPVAAIVPAPRDEF